jgi:hypothetical protein
MERHNDETLEDEERLFRRIKPEHVFYDEAEARYRPQSLAFRDGNDGEVSVYVSSMTTVESVLDGHPGFSLAAILAGLPRSHGCIVAKTPEDSNPAHRVIVHATKGGMRKVSKILADKAVWVKCIQPKSKS